MSNNLPTNPLQSLIASASAMPRDTGESAKYRTRHSIAGSHVILCDTSWSMSRSAGQRTRIAHLRDALNQVARPDHVLMSFASFVTPMQTPADLPAPEGGTCLELGLAAAAEHTPSATLVISDGEPNNPEAAIEVAARMSGRIDVIFCGDESNKDAIEFMRRLARTGLGRVVVHKWDTEDRQPIAGAMRMLLAGPAK